jgi:hypothetical protein
MRWTPTPFTMDFPLLEVGNNNIAVSEKRAGEIRRGTKRIG